MIHPPIPEGMELPFTFQTPKYYETYLKLSKDRIIFLTEDFTKEVSSALTALLLYYDNEAHDQEITIYIHSDGGDATALSNIYDVMQMIRAPIQTVCLGKAYSAGAFLLASGTAGLRFVMPHSQIMIHGIQCAFPILGEGHPTNSKNYFDFLEANNDSIMKMLAKHTGQDLEKVRQDCKQDVYMTAKEAIEYGLADDILG
jgi:ATP-dependent Clp protease, protease subunit